MCYLKHSLHWEEETVGPAEIIVIFHPQLYLTVVPIRERYWQHTWKIINHQRHGRIYLKKKKELFSLDHNLYIIISRYDYTNEYQIISPASVFPAKFSIFLSEVNLADSLDCRGKLLKGIYMKRLQYPLRVSSLEEFRIQSRKRSVVAQAS